MDESTSSSSSSKEGGKGKGKGQGNPSSETESPSKEGGKGKGKGQGNPSSETESPSKKGETMTPKGDYDESLVGATSGHQDLQDESKDDDSDGSMNLYGTDTDETSDESSKEYTTDPDDESERGKYLLKSMLDPDIYTVGRVTISDEKMISELSTSVLQHVPYLGPKEVYLICMIEGQDPMKIQNKKRNDSKNITGIHAEKILINQLKNQQHSNKTVTVYINNSPCYHCAKSLKKFVDENNIRLTLYVTTLYCIERMSCVKRKESHTLSSEETDAVYCGLRYLMLPGPGHCAIEAFTKEVWGNLLDALGLEGEKERFLLKYDRKKKGHDRSRKTEDIRVKKDLNYIKTLSLSKYKRSLLELNNDNGD